MHCTIVYPYGEKTSIANAEKYYRGCPVIIGMLYWESDTEYVVN